MRFPAPGWRWKWRDCFGRRLRKDRRKPVWQRFWGVRGIGEEWRRVFRNRLWWEPTNIRAEFLFRIRRIVRVVFRGYSDRYRSAEWRRACLREDGASWRG